MSDTSYNGYANYPTFAVHLWLTNDQGADEAARALASVAHHEGMIRSRTIFPDRDEHDPDHAAFARSLAADQIKEWVDELLAAEIDTASLAADLLNWALGQVDWHQITRSLLEAEKE